MRVGGIYVDIRGDITQLKKDMDAARHIVRNAGTDISDSLNNALSPKQIEGQLNTLISNLGKAQRASKLTADAFDGVGVELKELQHITGISEKRFKSLQSQMLQTRAQQQAERAFNAIAKATNASTLQMAKMRMQMGDVQGGLNELRGSVGKAVSSVLNLKNAFLGLGIGYVVKDLFEAGRSAAQMQKAFVEITGSTQGAAKEFAFLRDVADRLGQNFWDLQDSYKGLLAASKGTVLAGKETKNAFEGVIKASATLGLTSEKTERTLYALEQMISKGKIGSEELRVQMGDQLPGAFQMAAEAMDMTTTELDKALSAGKVFSEDFIPKFSKVLKERFSGEVDAATAATNKWNEALRDMKVQIAEAGFMDAMVDALKEATDIIKDPEFIRALSITATGMAQIAEQAIKGSAAIIKWASSLDYFKELEKMRTLPDIMNLKQLTGEAEVLTTVLNRLKKEGNENTKTFEETQKRFDEVNSRIKILNKSGMAFVGTINENTKRINLLGDTANKTFANTIPKGLQSSIKELEKFKQEYEKTFLSATEYAVKQIEKQAEEFKKAGIDAAKLEKWKNAQLKKLYAEDTENHKKEQERKAKDLSKRVNTDLDQFFGYLDTQEKGVLKQIEKEEKDRQKAADKIAKQQEKMWENIQEDTADILFNMLDDYENAWDNLADTIFDIFKRMLAEMAAEALMKPIIVPMVQSMQGALGLGGGGVSGMPGGGGGGISDILGMGRQAYGMMGGGAMLPFSGGGYLSALGASQVGTLPTGVGSMIGGGTMYGPGGGFGAGGLTYGGLGAAGALGSLGYGTIGGAIGLPQGEYSGMGAGAGAMGGMALGAEYGSIGGPVGAVVGAILGGVISSFIGGEDLPHKFRTEYGLELENLLSEQLGDISYMRAAGSQEPGFAETREAMEKAIDDIYTPQIEQLRSFIDIAAETGMDVETMLGDLASFSSRETISTRGHVEEGIEITMQRIADDFSQYAEDVLGIILPEYNEAITTSLEESLGQISEYMAPEFMGDIQEALGQISGEITPEAMALNAQVFNQVAQSIEIVTSQIDSMNASFQDVIDRNTLTDYEYQIKQINAKYDEYGVQLESFGIDVDSIVKLDQARQLELQAVIDKEQEYIASIKAQEAAALQAQKAQEAAQIEQYLSDFASILSDNISELQDLANAWDNISKSTSDLLMEMTFGAASQAPAEQRLADMWQYISAMDYSTIESAGAYQEALQEYLSLAQEAYQRPSIEYGEAYEQVYDALIDLQGFSESQRDQELKNAERQIELLETIANNTEDEQIVVNIDTSMNRQQILDLVYNAMQTNTGRVIIQQTSAGR